MGNKFKNKIVIIGAGLSGLSAAAKLAKNGFDVTVLEKNSEPGGRAITYKEKGFTFDIGPSWFMMPDVFEKYFKELKKDIKDYIPLERLDPSYRIYTDKNKYLDIYPDLEKNLKTFDSIEPGAGEQLQKYLQNAEFKYKTGLKYYVYRVYNSIFDFFDLRLIVEGLKLSLFTPLDRFVRRYFQNETLIRVLEFMVVFIGGSPYNIPALYTLLAYADLKLGVWYPKGGMNQVARGLEKLGKEFGVKYKYNAEVKKIEIDKNSNLKKIFTNTGTYNTKIVLSSADYPFVETKLLPKKYQSYNEKYWDKKILSPSSLLFFVGIDKKLSNMLHHTLFFNDSWNEHFNSIFKDPKWPKDILYYVSLTSKTDENVAPEGMENMVILVPLASGLKDDKKIHELYFDKIIEDIENNTGQKFKENIIVKRSYCLDDFKMDFNAYKGNAFGLAHTLFQTAIFRPSYKSKKIKDFYYTGQFTTPGVGMPIALISGQVIASEIIKRNGKSKA